MKVVGVMSGTSLDGMDIAIVDLQKLNGNINFELCYFTTIPYEKELKARLEKVVLPNTLSPEISSMNMLMGEIFADGVLLAIKEAGLQITDIDLVSTHGQTVFHDPVFKKDDSYYRPNTLQIGDIGVIAERTGTTVIGDFRTRDVAAGGQGAPLVPFLDYTLFKSKDIGRVLVNIGGISNITVIPKSASAESIIAYDTGPGNMIIDAFVSWHTNGEQGYDKNGQLAAKGNVNQAWLMELLANTYYGESPPKSTGREKFGKQYAKDLWNQAERRNISEIDRIATVTALTWYSLGEALKKHIEEDSAEEIVISGGGLHNASIIKGLKDYLPKNVSIKSSKELGIESDAKEAIAFAIFGYLGFHKQPNNLPAATGASKEVIMGKIAW
jgi:anhydro-N-acetylmuramic acid kinase